MAWMSSVSAPSPDPQSLHALTLLRELIDIPEVVYKGDFVMSLVEGVADKQATLKNYVVTEQLAKAYDNALGFIASAVRENVSKAAYLDGSFGSGKSHFMAVLHLLLQGDPEARAKPELAEPIAKYDSVLSATKFELIPFHMIDAKSMEQRIFGGYIEHLRELDPDAPLPGVYADGPLFEQAALRRNELGDEAFFARLNSTEDSSSQEGWGELAAPWNPETYERACSAPVGDPDRGRLGGTIVATLMPGFREAMRGSVTGYVDLDTGLAELARHAKARGAGALILFLDELILWLGSQIADPAFVAREGQKLIKLIEYTTPRPIPIISFVARQRDLREFVDDQTPGIEKLSFLDALKHWNDRFHRIELADRNLPKIAEKRLLNPKSPAAKQQLDAAFRETERARPEVLDILMTEDGDRELFRSIYPFSPAFMKALVAASSVLQRERTALRVMLQLLVNRRDELVVGDLVSVGDLFDVLAEGDEPFAEEMKRNFDHAKELFTDQLRPELVKEAPGDGTQPAPADERLIKTLLLAALVSRAAPLRNLDVTKLAALNHGSITSPVPGGEKAIILRKLRRWSSQVGALKVGEDQQNPSVEIRLTGVDVESIIERAESADKPGERRRLVKELVLEQMGVETDTRLFSEHTVLWRGTRRTVDVIFGNLRDTQDVPDESLRAIGEPWKVIIDYPFDQGHTPLDDLERLDRWREEFGATRTVCWIPAFFSRGLQRDLKRLVILRHVLSGERLAQYSDHLSPQDRQQAAGILGDLRSALEQRIAAAVRQAYGVERAEPDTIDPSHVIENRLQSLMPGFTPQLPIGAQLSYALSELIDQMLQTQYPAHPRFETEVRARELRIVLEEVERAVQAPGGRIDVPSDRRKIMSQIANPLKLGEQHEVPFLLGTHWKDMLDRSVALAQQSGSEQLTVADIRRWIDHPQLGIAEPQPLGLTREVQSLVVLVYAAQTGRTFRLHGGPAQPTIEKLDDDLELVMAQLPSEATWRESVRRAAAILGRADVNPARSARSFEALLATLREYGKSKGAEAEALVPELELRLKRFGMDPSTATRARTAAAGSELMSVLASNLEPVELLEQFCAIAIPTSDAALGRSITSAAAVRATLEDARWDVLELVRLRADADEPPFKRIIEELMPALEHDEFAEALAPAVKHAFEQGIALMQPPEPVPQTSVVDALVRQGDLTGVDIARARTQLEQLAQAGGDVRIDLHWTITSTDGGK
jgi:hypothetical protein